LSIIKRVVNEIIKAKGNRRYENEQGYQNSDGVGNRGVFVVERNSSLGTGGGASGPGSSISYAGN
jgi:hypothetical protein